MLHDSQTNKLFLADSLPKQQEKFYQRFEKMLNDCNIPFEFLPDTKDIWAVDFMPVQISKEKFVRFTYKPDYLQDRLWIKTISNADAICNAINITTKKSNLIVDGGNIVRTSDKVIMCDKVFYENEDISERDLIKQLKDLFEVDKLFFIPWDEYDFTGHADGMVRFIDNDTVLINDYSKESEEFQKCFRMSLHNAGLDWLELPYNPYNNKNSDSAVGVYINYLQMNQAIIIPTFKNKQDEQAVKVLEEVFKGQTIATVDSNEVAEEGGILNCITWNISV